MRRGPGGPRRRACRGSDRAARAARRSPPRARTRPSSGRIDKVPGDRARAGDRGGAPESRRICGSKSPGTRAQEAFPPSARRARLAVGRTRSREAASARWWWLSSARTGALRVGGMRSASAGSHRRATVTAWPSRWEDQVAYHRPLLPSCFSSTSVLFSSGRPNA